MAHQSTALVVGASRGLGLALAEQWLLRRWHVIATVRDRSEMLEELGRRFPGILEVETVDINYANSVRELRGRLTDRRLDVLFVMPASPAKSMPRPSAVPSRPFSI